MKSVQSPSSQPDLVTIGWRERVTFPELGIVRIAAKTDTGARNSSLHAFKIEEFSKGGAPWVRFGIHPKRHRIDTEQWCEAAVADTRVVRNSGGQDSHRYFIETELVIGKVAFSALVSLANRDRMGYRMLLGRTAIADRFLVDASRSYIQGRKRSSS